MASLITKVDSLTIRGLAKVIRVLVDLTKGVDYGQAHYRGLELLKVTALRESRGDFDAKIQLN